MGTRAADSGALRERRQPEGRELYGAISGKADDRSLFVIDPSGKIVKRMQPFNQLSTGAYDELEAAVKQSLPH